MSSIAEDYPKQLDRVREARNEAAGMLAQGFNNMQFYVSVADDLISRATDVAIKGDVVQKLALYQELKDFKE